jgi:hypothetical protein
MRRDFVAAVSLFVATAAVVLWQNAHLVVLWDLSYVLDSATRMAQGQMPYRDFPFAHAPLTFLVQAAIMRLTGRVFFHHVLYCALVGGLSTVLAWRIVLRAVKGAWWISVLLAAPLCVVGIYCILPTPSYDCDCVFSNLVALWLLQRLERSSAGEHGARHGSMLWLSFGAGAAVVVPLFFKQNIGLVFLVAVAAVFLVLLGARLVSRMEVSEDGPGTASLLAALGGVGTALAAAALLLHFTAGVRNYIRWTIGFAAQRRLPGLQQMIGVYREPALLWMLPCVAMGLMLWQSRLGKATWARVAALGLLAAPFLWTIASLLVYDDPDERGDSLLALWPLLLTLSATLTLWNLRRGPNLCRLLPCVVLLTINGTLMSQQLWGSTYAIWPLLILLVAEMVAFLATKTDAGEWQPAGAKARGDIATLAAGLKSCPVKKEQPGWTTRPDAPAECLTGGPIDPSWKLTFAPLMAVVVAGTLLVCGGFYTASEERLSYAQFPDGPAVHATFPPLAGMATPGPYLPNFEELLRFADAHIPASDGMILIPGEDPFYFATGRLPQFPVLLFDPATDPYSPDEVVEQARAHNIRWLVVKRDLQIKEDPTPDGPAVLKALMGDFAPVARLQGYDVFRRR